MVSIHQIIILWLLKSNWDNWTKGDNWVNWDKGDNWVNWGNRSKDERSLE